MLFQLVESKISALFFSITVVALAHYFGQPEIFDPIFLVTLVFVAVAFRRNIDLVSISMIFIVERLVEELVWRVDSDSYTFLIPSYLITAVFLLKSTRHVLRLVSILFFLIVVLTEIYWYTTDYDKPNIFWTYYLFFAAIIVRFSLRRRMFWLVDFMSKEGNHVRVTNSLLLANGVFIFSYIAITIEYIVRHVFKIADLLFFYNSLAYISSTLSVFILYMLTIESIRYLLQIELNA